MYCTDNGPDNIVSCAAAAVGASQQFTLAKVGYNQYSIKGGNGKYCSDRAKGFVCDTLAVNASEKFTLEKRSDNVYAIKGAGQGGKYCSDQSTGVTCTNATIAPWEKFTLELSVVAATGDAPAAGDAVVVGFEDYQCAGFVNSGGAAR
jgi:hypothetical protein